MYQPTEKAIDYAVKRLVTFALINKSQNKDQKVKSLDRVAQAVGLDPKRFDYLMTLLSKHYEEVGSITVGVLIGLFIAEYEFEKQNKNNLSDRPTSL